MLKVGITGGIGSGKTTVCQIFAALGIPIYYADDRAKALMVEDPALRRGIIDLFGPLAYTDDGQLNRTHLAERAFANDQLLQQLNNLVHPAVWRDAEAWTRAHADAPYTLKEAALTYESGGDQFMDRMIVVAAPDEMRIQRVQDRDGLTRQQVLDRLNQQMPQQEKIDRADFVIHNDGRLGLMAQVLDIHQQLLAEAQKAD